MLPALETTLTDADAVKDSLLAVANTVGTYGEFVMDANGAWSYTLDTTNAEVLALTTISDPLVDMFNIASAEGAMTTVDITINGVLEPTNTPATFAGDLAADILASDTTAITGMITVTDPDMGEDVIIEQTNVAQTYGSFSIGTDGAWTYTLDTTNSDVQALLVDETLLDPIPFMSGDGTAGLVEVTINGIVEPPAGGNKIAQIIDTLDTDTGELRYALGGDGPLAAGRVEARVKRLDDSLGNGDAFITLFNETTSNSGAILDLRIRDSSFGIRDSAADADAGNLPLTLDAFMDVVITWEYPAGDVSVAPQVTVEVDGVTVGPFTTTNSPFNGVTHVAFRFGDNSGVRLDTGIFSVDDFAIYSDTAGTTEVFADDFEGFANGDSLDTDNPASPYNSSTSEATVFEEGTPANTGPNQIAEIVDTLDTDTGELRYALGGAGPLAAGRVEAKVKRLDDNLGNGDAFITLFNETTSNSGAILDLRIRDSSFGFRDTAADASALPLTLDAFMDVAVIWEYPAGDVSVAPQVTVEVDGVSVGPFTTTNSPFNGVTHVAFRFGDNSGVRLPTGIFSVDDLAIYSDTAGTTEVFADDFESYSEGDSLDTDNVASPYNSSTSEATVAVE